MADFTIRPAGESEAPVLRALTLRAKAWWNDPPGYLAAWKAALEMDAPFLRRSVSYVAADGGGKVAGYYSLLFEAAPGEWNGFDPAPNWWLDNLFIDPPFIGAGLGATLYRHALGEVAARGGDALYLLSDAHAAGFYTHMGAVPAGEKASIVPSVTLPVLVHRL